MSSSPRLSTNSTICPLDPNIERVECTMSLQPTFSFHINICNLLRAFSRCNYQSLYFMCRFDFQIFFTYQIRPLKLYHLYQSNIIPIKYLHCMIYLLYFYLISQIMKNTSLIIHNAYIHVMKFIKISYHYNLKLIQLRRYETLTKKINIQYNIHLA